VVFVSALQRHDENTLSRSLRRDEPFTTAAFAASLGVAAPNTMA
jgi:hypothetical protein